MDSTRDVVVLSAPSFPSVPSNRVIEPPEKTREFVRRPARGWLESAPSPLTPFQERPSSQDPK